jgi:hypothetical protein
VMLGPTKPPLCCPCCGEELIDAAEVDSSGPVVVFTITLCGCCGHLMTRTEGGFRDLDPDERKYADHNPLVDFASRLIAEVKKSKLS